MPDVHVVPVVIATLAGLAAGHIGRTVLAGLRTPVPAPPGACEGTVAAVWLVLAARAMVGAMPPWWVPVPAALAWLAVVLTATDLRHRRLPNALTLPAYPAAALLILSGALAGPGPGLAVRAAAAAALLVAVHAAVHLAAPGHLGAGDVKLAGLVGAVLGAVSWSAFLLGPIIAAVITAVLALASRANRRDVPHGPGLLLAALLVSAFPASGALAG